MSAWFDALHVMEQVCLFIALPATLIMLIQTLLLFFGGDSNEPGDTGLDSDVSGIGSSSGTDLGSDFTDAGSGFETDFEVDGDISFDSRDAELSVDTPEGTMSHKTGRTDGYGLRFLTMRGIIAFLTVAGWTGILGMELGLQPIISGMVAAGFGFGAMVGIALLVQSLMRLQSNGNINYKLALGSLADVYLTIPANGAGAGKVTLQLNGAFAECDAITEGDISIRTGRLVRVTDVVCDSILVVEALDGGGETTERTAIHERRGN